MTEKYKTDSKLASIPYDIEFSDTTRTTPNRTHNYHTVLQLCKPAKTVEVF